MAGYLSWLKHRTHKLGSAVRISPSLQIKEIMKDGKVNAYDIPEIIMIITECYNNIGRIKLTYEQLPDILKRKQKIHKKYVEKIETINGLSMAKVPDYAQNNHWLNILQIESENFGETPEQLMNRLDENNIQTRPVWALNHLQKIYRNCQSYKIKKGEDLISKSLCLPSSSNLLNGDINKISNIIWKRSY